MSAITIKLDTHSDCSDGSSFFKWTYHEDWELRAHKVTRFYFDYKADTVAYFKDFLTENKYYCWQKYTSSDILIANSEKLSSDIISGMKIKDIYQTDNRISTLYAIEVYQEKISKESFKYWQTLQRNNEELGGIFSPQPNEMPGNIKSVTFPDETVIGYIDASVCQTKRIFISNKDVDYFYTPKDRTHVCLPVERFHYPSQFREAFDSGFDVGEYMKDSTIVWYDKKCLDCRYYGTKIRPDYWPGDYR